MKPSDFSKPAWIHLGMWVLLWTACASTPENGDRGPSTTALADNAGSESSLRAGEALEGETVKKFDLNHDNKPDVWAYYRGDHLVRKEWDFNFDSKVDIRRYFNEAGEMVKDELDLDFDGRFDVTTHYANGQKTFQEYDFNFDTKPDYWKFFEKQAIVRTERDRDFNGRVDRWEYYTNGQLERVGLDEDGDGQIDRWLQIDAAKE